MSNNNKNKFDWTRLWLWIITIIGIFTFLLTLVYVLYVLREIHVSSLVDSYCTDKAVLELTKLQGKIIDNVSITFLTTLLLALFISIGIFLINKYDEAFRRYKKDLEEIMIKGSIFNIYPFVNSIFVNSIYLLSNNIRNGNVYSVFYQINRLIIGLTSILKQIKYSDTKNREILLYYIGNTLDNLNSYIKQNNLNSTYANDIIKKIKDIREQIEKLEVIDLNDSKGNFKLRQ